ncbi:hypothetical protein B0A48_05561 [Cryoendolithus antarcticus]|uniref:PCI domain-containing protein n=1 Tax=Cryoendolithus antarcticus TaxID=1507870 RepID=A0A1V8TIU1_9PEZI|nr:hypothetical protein B0A48_05561 [Cryoendolithus antarcticus]
MATPMLGQFLTQINGFIKARNETSLTDYLVLEPPFAQAYTQIISELRATYPAGNDTALEAKCAQLLPEAEKGDQGATWTAFIRYMVTYLGYLRDVSADQGQYRRTYELLSEVQGKVNSALSHSTLGYLILRTAISNARLVCRLAIGLDRHPELLGPLKTGGGGEEGGARETLPEKAANTIRVAFTTALNDRSGSQANGLDSNGQPEGRRKGVYALANLCLKILFQCKKTRNASQIFQNITSNAPPLDAYPKAQQVTYLYYLGRFLWQNGHFGASAKVLGRAWEMCHAGSGTLKQRRSVLIYLIASNLLLGRFPSTALLSLPEAHGLTEKFMPICLAIRSGNLAALRNHLDFNSEHAAWFLHFRLLLQLRNRCEVLTWRSLVRKVFLLKGTLPEAGSNKAAFLDLPPLVAAFRAGGSQNPGLNPEDEPDPDLEGTPDFNSKPETGIDEYGVISILSSLVDQGLLRGFVAHKQQKLAILGSKNFGGNAVAAGFPAVWGVIGKKGGEGGVVGWKT